MKSSVLRYIAGFLGWISLIYGIIVLFQIKEISFTNVISIEDLALLFIGIFALSYAFTDKIMIEKPFAILSALILFYFTIFYTLPLLNKILLLTGGIIETQLASRKGKGGTFYTIIGLLLLVYFVYIYLINYEFLSLIGVSLASLSLVLANRDKGFKLLPYITFPLGIPLILYSFISISPLILNPLPLVIGLALILINLIPTKNSTKPAPQQPKSVKQKIKDKSLREICKEINNENCNEAIIKYKNFIYSKYGSFIPDECVNKILSCVVHSNDLNTFKLILGSPIVRELAEKNFLNVMSPEMIYLLANVSSNKDKLLELACNKGFQNACNELKLSLNVNNWDPKLWVGKEIYGYKIVDMIGIGGTSYVLRGIKDNNEYAIKIPLVKYVSNIMDLVSESSKLIELSNKSPYIVKLYAIYADQLDVKAILNGDAGIYLSKPPLIVIELMRGGSANDLINYQPLVKSEYWIKILYIIISKIAQALEVIHSEGYVHCDIKPQNILFSEKIPPYGRLAYENLLNDKIKVKLADLGSAVRAGQKPFSYTPPYAPFDLVKAAIFGGVEPTADIYSLGATVYKLITGTQLNSKEMIEAMEKFENSKDDRYLSYSLYNTRNLDLLKYYIRDSEIYNFIIRMVDPEPNKRPTSREVREFFSRKI